jgi:hypothetical protein
MAKLLILAGIVLIAVGLPGSSENGSALDGCRATSSSSAEACASIFR